MTHDDPTFDQLPLHAKRRIDAVCARFEDGWRAGRPDIAAYLAEGHDGERPVLLVELLLIELECRRRRGETPLLEDYLAKFPAHASLLRVTLRSPALETNPDPLTTHVPEAGPQ